MKQRTYLYSSTFRKQTQGLNHICYVAICGFGLSSCILHVVRNCALISVTDKNYNDLNRGSLRRSLKFKVEAHNFSLRKCTTEQRIKITKKSPTFAFSVTIFMSADRRSIIIVVIENGTLVSPI